jgi:integrase/recombinase XerD
MPKAAELRPPSRTAKRPARRAVAGSRFEPTTRRPRGELAAVVRATAAIWRRAHLDYDQARDVARAVRAQLELARPQRRATVARLGHEHTTSLIAAAYRATAQRRPRGLLVKTLLESGARVAEFVGIRAEDVYFDEAQLWIRKGKGGKARAVPILPTLADELRTYLGGRRVGYLFEGRGARAYSTRRVQQIVREVADEAGLAGRRVYPHLLRHELAQHLLEHGMPLDQVQLVLGHAKIETTQIYAQATTAMVRDNYQRAMVGAFTRGRSGADRGEARGAAPDRGDSDTRPARASGTARAPRESPVDRAPGSRSPRGQVRRPGPRRGGAIAGGRRRELGRPAGGQTAPAGRAATRRARPRAPGATS